MRRLMTKPYVVALSWVALLSLVSAAASGQPFPNRPIRMVVPFEAGSNFPDASERAASSA